MPNDNRLIWWVTLKALMAEEGRAACRCSRAMGRRVIGEMEKVPVTLATWKGERRVKRGEKR